MKLIEKLAHDSQRGIDQLGDLFPAAAYEEGFQDGFRKAQAMAARIAHETDDCYAGISWSIERDIQDMGEEEILNPEPL